MNQLEVNRKYKTKNTISDKVIFLTASTRGQKGFGMKYFDSLDISMNYNLSPTSYLYP